MTNVKDLLTQILLPSTTLSIISYHRQKITATHSVDFIYAQRLW